MTKIPTPEMLLSRYFVHLRMNNWSARTIDRRSYSLGRFIAWCAERGIDCVSEVTGEAIQCYRRGLFHHRNARTGKPIVASDVALYWRIFKTLGLAPKGTHGRLLTSLR